MEVGDQIFSVNDEIIIEKKTTKNVINDTGSFITLHLYKKGKSFIIGEKIQFRYMYMICKEVFINFT